MKLTRIELEATVEERAAEVKHLRRELLLAQRQALMASILASQLQLRDIEAQLAATEPKA